MPGLKERITRILGLGEPPRRSIDTETGLEVTSVIDAFARLWRIRDTREAVHADMDRMDNEDEIISSALDINADTATGLRTPGERVIQIECDDDRMRKDAEEVIDQAELESKIWGICRRMLKYGQDWHEFIVGSDMQFARLKHLPDEQRIFRNTDDRGRLRTGDPEAKQIDTCAYDQRDDSGSFLAGFYPWQIVRFARKIDKYGYGTPLMKPARKNYKRLSILEDSMAVARLTRAYQKLMHKIPVPKNADKQTVQDLITQYKRNITQLELLATRGSAMVRSRIENPLSVTTDFYIADDGSGRGGIESIDPSNPQLQNLSDIEYYQNKIFAVVKTPKAYLGTERDVNAKATLSWQDIAFARFIGGVQGCLVTGAEMVIAYALILKGYRLEDVLMRLTVMLPSAFKSDKLEEARIETLNAQAAERHIKNKVITRDFARRQYFEMTDEESQEEEKKILAEIERVGDPASTPGMSMFESSVQEDKLVLEMLHQMRRAYAGGDNGSRPDRPARIPFGA